MSDMSASIFRVSMNVLTFAVKGNQNGIVQQQIETMGLRQWLSVAATCAAGKLRICRRKPTLMKTNLIF
jgi:hypothetical protein